MISSGIALLELSESRRSQRMLWIERPAQGLHIFKSTSRKKFQEIILVGKESLGSFGFLNCCMIDGQLTQIY